MPGVPSNKACERCKKKHLKCDETRPQCQRCTTAGLECPGYVQTRKFIDQGATVRRRYAPYQDVNAKSGHASKSGAVEESAQSIPSQPGTATGQGQVPSSTVDQIPPFNAAATDLNTRYDQQMAQADPSSQLDFGASQNAFFVPDSSEVQPGLGGQHSSRSSRSNGNEFGSPNLAMGFGSTSGNTYTGTPSSRLDHPSVVSTESISQRSEKEEFQDLFSELTMGTEHEIAFLTRHYSEFIAPWLDLSDSGKFFSVYVPIRAINSLCLKYAITSLAAKHLGRVRGMRISARDAVSTSPATTEVYPNADHTDWFLKAANYYYMSGSDLNNTTSGGYTAVSSTAVLESPIEIVSRWLNSRSTQELAQGPNNGSLIRKAEDVLSTVTLLTLYRLLDLKGDEWHKHLSGIRPLFESLLHLNQSQSTFFPHGIRASFWNFARQDYLGSYFTRSRTHLNPANLSMWRAAGLSTDDQNKFQIATTGSLGLKQEDQAANGLTWLVSKVINFLAQSKQSQIAQWTGSPPSNPTGDAQDSSTETDTNMWMDLSFEFQTWFEGVPETFRPCVRIENPRDLSKLPDGAQLPFPEVFYSLPTCAATMQHYHFGRIALLLNRPPDIVSAPSTAFDRLQGYREVTKEVEYRSREICGIALGRPQGEIRVHMITLFLAVGQCLEKPDEQRIIVDLLRGIETDLGWSTEYVIQNLQTSWNR